MPAERELPRYQCHKKVWAVKIAAIEFLPDRVTKIAPKDEGYGTITLDDPDYRHKFKGNDDDLGYLVIYQDGYKSWSPSAAFVDGYARIS